METRLNLNRETLVNLTAQGKAQKDAIDQVVIQARAEAQNLAREQRQQRVAEVIAKRLDITLMQIDKNITNSAAKGEEEYTKIFTVKHTGDAKGRFDHYPGLEKDKIKEETEVTTGVIQGVAENYTSLGLSAIVLRPVEKREDIYDPKDGVVGSYIREINYGIEISWVEPNQR